MKKKRTSLDAFLTRSVEVESPAVPPAPEADPANAGNRPGIKQQTAYLKTPVYEQLRRLAFDERSKMHDYLIEGLDLVFRKRGLPGIKELGEKGA
jgi:hypothetical protein